MTRERILARMPHNLRTLRHLLQAAAAEFPRFPPGRLAATAGPRLRRNIRPPLRKAALLAEELSPRTELLDRWTDELRTPVRRP